MGLTIYNTIHRQKEKFNPLVPGQVSMYVCGPTVYDLCHIGNARSVVVFDVVARYLRFSGFEVTYVRNFTDVDDKIIQRAQLKNIPPNELAEMYIDAFYADMDDLKVERATIEPRATQYIEQMRQFIETLIDKKLAYAVEGDVFYAVDQFAEYGKLSGRRLEDMEAGARVEVEEKKQNPFDFALWKAAKPGEPSWESPWGRGRPGWHIECSVMSSSLLGQTFDIHGGGKDLIFPHHENEIAQSEGANGKPFARYWMHNGYVNINREKMSKSLGNFMFTRDVLKRYHAEVIRLFLLSNHYRNPIDFSDQNLNEAETGLEKAYTFLSRLNRIPELVAVAAPSSTGDLLSRFRKAMDDDFNSAKGIGVLFDGIRQGNTLLDQSRDNPSSEQINTLAIIRNDILQMGAILGILLETPDDFFEQKRTEAVAKSDLDTGKIEALIAQRDAARQSKDWKSADAIRDQLSKMGVAIEDQPQGTVWKTVIK